eukprot:scaffold2800_cov283-Chaetoceros_neogracile.AAC.2
MEIQIQIGTDHPVMAENLLRTEDVYRKDNPLPPDHALKYLNLLENIRERRQDLIQVHVDGGIDKMVMVMEMECRSSKSATTSQKDPNQSNGIIMAANGPLGSASTSTDTYKSSWKIVGGLTAHKSHDCFAKADC